MLDHFDLITCPENWCVKRKCNKCQNLYFILFLVLGMCILIVFTCIISAADFSFLLERLFVYSFLGKYPFLCSPLVFSKKLSLIVNPFPYRTFDTRYQVIRFQRLHWTLWLPNLFCRLTVSRIVISVFGWFCSVHLRVPLVPYFPCLHALMFLCRYAIMPWHACMFLLYMLSFMSLSFPSSHTPHINSICLHTHSCPFGSSPFTLGQGCDYLHLTSLIPRSGRIGYGWCFAHLFIKWVKTVIAFSYILLTVM